MFGFVAEHRKSSRSSNKGNTLPLGHTAPKSVPIPIRDEIGEDWGDAPPVSQGPPRPDIEVRIIRDDTADHGRMPWRAFEVWTKNHLYGFDSGLYCIDVVDRVAGKRVTQHAMLGAKLGGGRWLGDRSRAICYPLPLPGTVALTMHKGKQSETSLVERVVMRIRVVATPEGPSETWEDIAQKDSTKTRRK